MGNHLNLRGYISVYTLAFADIVIFPGPFPGHTVQHLVRLLLLPFWKHYLLQMLCLMMRKSVGLVLIMT